MSPDGLPDGPPNRPIDDAGDPADEGGGGRARPRKAPSAFRTISEVADDLHIPQHVLRFWETKFQQVRPLKRGGGRRYYRPDDIALLRRISDLLYIQGYTIKGVQRLLREGGGRLSDDIPPAAPDERAEAEAERAQAMDLAAQLPMLDLPAIDAPPPPLSVPSLPPRVALDPAPAPAAPHPAEAEVARLRTTLRHLLRELEAIRALLP